ncbi:MAG: hypothetical protein M3N39_11200 [Pseudomonadota bacterium]|nr:hypothetical protein [Pseudomonadota bacterium]
MRSDFVHLLSVLLAMLLGFRIVAGDVLVLVRLVVMLAVVIHWALLSLSHQRLLTGTAPGEGS